VTIDLSRVILSVVPAEPGQQVRLATGHGQAALLQLLSQLADGDPLVVGSAWKR